MIGLHFHHQRSAAYANRIYLDWFILAIIILVMTIHSIIIIMSGSRHVGCLSYFSHDNYHIIYTLHMVQELFKVGFISFSWSERISEEINNSTHALLSSSNFS